MSKEEQRIKRLEEEVERLRGVIGLFFNESAAALRRTPDTLSPLRVDKCEAIQYSGQIGCVRCGLVWDINELNPPKCKEGV